jgi:hypothetical protein
VVLVRQPLSPAHNYEAVHLFLAKKFDIASDRVASVRPLPPTKLIVEFHTSEIATQVLKASRARNGSNSL